jgi:L-rhamnonate dehydratase
VTSTRIASGEHEYTRFGFQELVRHNAVEILQPDVTWCGGFTEARRIAALAAAKSLPVAPHRGGSPWGLALACSTPNCILAESELGAENELARALGSRFAGGYYYPSEKPGFGVELSAKLIRAHAR